MAKDYRPMPKGLSDEEIWRWVIGDESPLVVASEFRDRGVLTNVGSMWH